MFRKLFAVVFLALTFAAGADAAPLADQPEGVTPLLIGGRVPDASLQTLDGNGVSLRTVLDGKPSIVVFYRGGWCPFCNLQLGQINQAKPALAALGYQIIALTPDPPEAVKRTLGDDKLDYAIYSDRQIEALKAFGVGYRVKESQMDLYRKHKIDLAGVPGAEADHALPVPAIFIVDGKGIIQFVYVNPDYRIRLSPDLLLAAAKASLNVQALKPN
ncbi:peroxiredoxin [Tahibacter aquaticus]|uniref:thioredoxin-dependent peroxiredoxin n=1 Tax=Tahibacter aquaticus TaxID=520092 RepID=A0A4R6Z9G3_9GAMM|nr:peroxiredoxin-like family protein [Tahibacter aquaticus]TDR48540.1 peroxiredoxin [Tahibacter aquaticus]